MKPSAYLINGARRIVDEAALVAALGKSASPAQRSTCSAGSRLRMPDTR
jgi:hypothetical protein